MKNIRTIKVICNCDTIFMRIPRENVLNFNFCNASRCFNFKTIFFIIIILQ